MKYFSPFPRANKSDHFEFVVSVHESPVGVFDGPLQHSLGLKQKHETDRLGKVALKWGGGEAVRKELWHIVGKECLFGRERD